jgi:hypothetical protein
MRRVLGPLAKMAEDLNVAVVLLRHPTKAGARDPLLNGGGSIGIIGAARVALLTGYDPDDTEEDLNLRRRLLAVAKCNLAPKATTLAYRLQPDVVYGCARVMWEGPTGHRAGDLLHIVDGRESKLLAMLDELDSEKADKEDFLRDALRDGPVLAAEIAKAADLHDWTLQSLSPTFKKMGGRKYKTGFGENQRWWWTLQPDDR